MHLTNADRLNRLDAYIAEGRLIRNKWVGTDAEGRATACLLAALAPECGAIGSAASCPAEVMPRWLAELTPWIDDSGSDAAWPGMVRRYAAVARRWHVLNASAWERASRRVRAACVREALRHVTRDGWGVRDACEAIAVELEANREPSDEQRSSAEAAEAAEAAARAALAAEAAAAALAARAALAAEAAEAAALAVWAAAARAARAAARAALAADRLTDAILTVLEDECAHAERGR
jgi:hypothetical protein